MGLDKALKSLVEAQIDRFLNPQSPRSSTSRRIDRPMPLACLQSPILGALALGKSMGPVMYEAGRRAGMGFCAVGVPLLKKMPGYRDFALAEDIEEAKRSTEYDAVRTFFQVTHSGLIELVRFKKDREAVYRVRECADCAGIDSLAAPICHFTAGFIAGGLENLFERTMGYTESKCAAIGDEYCEFRYIMSKNIIWVRWR